ncbi:UNVERIFIED_CONTAM: hypothetical protein RMT77_006411 [Armadillidium vulgare]
MMGFLNILCFISVLSHSIASNNEEKLKEQKGKIDPSLLQKKAELEERLSRQLKWFEAANVVFPNLKPTKKSEPKEDDEGRLLKFINVNRGVSHLDMLFQTLAQAATDLHDVCEEIADKFENFVNEDQANILANEAGRQRLLDMLNEFRTMVLNQATAAANSAVMIAGGGGLLPGLIPGMLLPGLPIIPGVIGK